MDRVGAGLFLIAFLLVWWRLERMEQVIDRLESRLTSGEAEP